MTIHHIRSRGEDAWHPPGLTSTTREVRVPDIPYDVLWRPELFAPRSGGMGQVWPGRHISDGSFVLLKFLDVLGGSPAGPTERTLFAEEARRGCAVSSEHVVKYREHVELPEPWRPVLIMEWADLALDDLLLAMKKLKSEEGAAPPLPVPLIRRLLADAAQGLHHLHGLPHRLVHNDIKPGNLFLKFLDRAPAQPPMPMATPHDVMRAVLNRPLDHVRLLVGDLGVGQPQTERPRRFGQDGYKGKEQTDEPPLKFADPRTDLYGLGKVLDELLTWAADPQPPGLKVLAAKCQADRVADRPASAEAVRRAAMRLAYHDSLYQTGIDEVEVKLKEQGVEYIARKAIENAFATVAAAADCRILRIKGGPGTGKSTAVAHLARTRACGPAFFFSALSRPSWEIAVEKICAALRDHFELQVDLPKHYGAEDLKAHLRAVAEQRGHWLLSGERLWLYLDGLDETDQPLEYRRYLPLDNLPDHVRLVVSSRPEPQFEDLDAARGTVLVDLDDAANREQTLNELQEFVGRLLPEDVLPDILALDVAAAVAPSFLMARLVCEDWTERRPGLAEARDELAALGAVDFTGKTGAEENLHRVYRKYFWERVERQAERLQLPLAEFETVAGFLAVAEGALPGVLLRKYDASLTHARELLRVLQPFLVRVPVSGPEGASLDGYRFAHRTFQTFITSTHCPAGLTLVPDELRRKLLDYYSPPGRPDDRPPSKWDHYGLEFFIRLCLRQERPPAHELAIATLKRADFLQAVIAAPKLGVHVLREMVRQVRDAVA